MGTPLEYAALGGIDTMLHFQYTYNRFNHDGQLIENDTDTISGHTPKAVKHVLVKRFRLQGTGGTWTSLLNGSHKRSHQCHVTGERHCLTLKPISKGIVN